MPSAESPARVNADGKVESAAVPVQWKRIELMAYQESQCSARRFVPPATKPSPALGVLQMWVALLGEGTLVSLLRDSLHWGLSIGEQTDTVGGGFLGEVYGAPC